MDFHYGNMLGGFGIISFLWIVLWLIIIIGGVLIIWFMIRNNNQRHKEASSSIALKILKERFARGEIDENEFKSKRDVLEEE